MKMFKYDAPPSGPSPRIQTQAFYTPTRPFTMTMEIEPFELDIEDVLRLHQGWITKLFVEDGRTEVEIVRLLYERRLVVTVAQVHQCLLNWNLTTPPVLPSPPSSTPSETSTEDWEIIHTRAALSKKPYMFPPSPPTSLDPRILDIYTKRPLPSIPKDKSPSTKTQHRPIRLELSVRQKILDKYDVAVDLDSDIEGSSPLENYVMNDQAHERLAMGLSRASQERSGAERVPRVFWPSATRRPGYHHEAAAERDQKKDEEREEGEEPDRPKDGQPR